MRVFSTASFVGQTFKNVGRLSEILKVLATHGFEEIVVKVGLARFLPAKSKDEESRFKHLAAPVRLRLAFERLGPTFVKFGQLLATRADLLPAAFVQEFQKLQDRVSTVDYTEIAKFVSAELHRPVHEVFEVFNETPMAAASIAQVHAATLKTGEHVAVKIQRPGIEKTIKNDISILKGLALLLDRYIPEIRPLNPIGIVDEFFRTIAGELDFNVEANNMRRIRQNLSSLKKVAVPQVYSKYSTGRIIVMERFEGVRFSDRAKILERDIDPVQIIETGCDAFFHMVMKDGLFHGDLHAGNLFILPDGRLGIIDFGIVGRLSRKVKDSVITIFIALIDEDYETLASEYAYLSRSEGKTDLTRLQKDLMDLISPYVGMTLGEVNIGSVLLQSTAVAAKNHLTVPRELMLLFKALVTIEGLGKSLDPEFDLLPVGTRLAKEALSARYSKEQIVKDLMLMGRDIQVIAELFPGLMKRFLRRWSQNNFAIETRNQDIRHLARGVNRFTYFLVQTTFSVTLFTLGIVLLILKQWPTLLGVSVPAFFVISASFWLQAFGLWQLRKHRK